jgi:mannose-1-phosphate guanylyltransferase
MNALLLAAGKGTRLRPITDYIPKCLVKVGGRPLLDTWLGDLSRVGFTHFLVNTHYLSEQVTSHLSDHPLGSSLRTVWEPELLGTAGTLFANSTFVEECTTLVAHADNYCSCDWLAFIEAHRNRPSAAMMTMMTFRTPTPQSCGIVELDENGLVADFHEKKANPPGDLANAAIYIIEPEVIRFMKSLNPPISDISTELIPRLLGKIFAWHNNGTLIDIGTPESLDRANALIEAQGIR